MSIDTTKRVHVIRIDVGDEIDLADDEYGDNELAMFGFAEVLEISEWKDEDGDLWVNLHTTQGEYGFPSWYEVKRKVME